MSPIGDWYQDDAGHWVYDSNAPASDPALTRIGNPFTPAEPRPGGDVGDEVDPFAPDPTGDEVHDPGDPNYVEPWRPT